LSFNDLCSEQNQAGFMNEPHTDRPGGSAVAQGPAVCIAYSHEDRSYLDELHAYLTPYARTGEIDFWDDTKIKPGANWQAERASAFRRARIVVLLVSIDFLASDEIAKQILPALLTAAGKQEVQLFSVILRPCSFEQSVLAPFRSFNNSQTPLSGMNRNRREAFWAQLVESIKDSLK